jgi:hypothetical protein
VSDDHALRKFPTKMMPRAGAIIFGGLIGKLGALRIEGAERG